MHTYTLLSRPNNTIPLGTEDRNMKMMKRMKDVQIMIPCLQINHTLIISSAWCLLQSFVFSRSFDNIIWSQTFKAVNHFKSRDAGKGLCLHRGHQDCPEMMWTLEEEWSYRARRKRQETVTVIYHMETSVQRKSLLCHQIKRKHAYKYTSVFIIAFLTEAGRKAWSMPTTFLCCSLMAHSLSMRG